jgi:ABC-type lipoprotein export system ATPase subunit
MAALITASDVWCARDESSALGKSRVEGVSLVAEAGRIHAFCGEDGCGKGLLLNLLGLLESPDRGSVAVGGCGAASLEASAMRSFRNETFGFLFAHPCLLPSFSVAENVAMPLFRFCGGEARDARERTLEVLELTGIADFESDLVEHLPMTIQRRVALARAIVHRPRVLVAISPRGAGDILPVAVHLARLLDVCVLWAGDHAVLRPWADVVFSMRDGRIAEAVETQ